MRQPAPEVTFLVVAYNHAAYVEQCLDSIAAQATAWRAIIVDDASTDGTPDVIKAYLERTGFPATFVAHGDNRGLGASLAEGLDLVETEFLAYIAADDWMEPGRTHVQIAAMREAGPDCALSYSDVYRADQHGEFFDDLLSVGMGSSWQPAARDVYEALLEGNWIPAPSIMVRVALLRRVGGYDPEIPYEDHDVALRLARHYSFAYVPTPVATHRELSTSLGAHLFFEPWMEQTLLTARVNIYRKHLGVAERYDRVIVPMVHGWLLRLYLAGYAPGWVSRAAPRAHAL